MLFRIFIISLCLGTAGFTYAEFYTYRVLSRSGSFYNAMELEFTPDSQKLLFTSKKGTLVIGVDAGRILYDKPVAAFSLAVTRDSKQALLASTKNVQAINLETGAVANIRWRLDSGYLGCLLAEEAGKLVLEAVNKGGPIEAAGIPVGSELIAVHEFGETKSVLGRGVDKASSMMRGPAGTRIGLTFIPRGKRGEKRYDLVRSRGNAEGGSVQFLPERPHREGAPCTIFTNGDYIVMLDAATGEVNSVLATEEVRMQGQRAISPDGKIFCTLGKRRSSGPTRHLIETYDLATRERLFTTPFDDSWSDVRFHPKTGEFLIGSHDSVYVMDPESKQIERQINLGWKPTLRADEAENGSTGWWLKETRGRSEHALLQSFDMSPEGILAVAAPSGEVATWSSETGEKLRQFNPPGRHKAEEVRLSADGKWIAYYVGGLLTLETVEPDPEE